MAVKNNAKTEKAIKNNGLFSFFKEVKAELRNNLAFKR